jgi:2-polyprenyl-6-methoxyphenol hydroxylase-like FAD-dependent oxidoreductase
VARGLAYDALIVGGGPAGASAALVLARAGWRVGLLHRSPPPARHPLSASLVRTGETLPAESRTTLGALGLWPAFLQDGHLQSPGTVAWWDGETPLEQDGVFHPLGPGWHVDRHRFDRRLRDAAKVAGAEVVDDARLVDAQFVDDRATSRVAPHWRIALERRSGLSECIARVLIVATGRSKVAVPQGIVRRRLDCLIALATLAPAAADLASVDHRTWIEATATGWWYSAPTPGGEWTITFFTDADHVPRTEGREAITRYWQQQLASSMHTRRRTIELGLTGLALSHANRPAALQIMAADSYRQIPCHGQGWFAAGDTAAAWDPLSGQGVEKGLRSGLRVARTADAVLRGDDIAVASAGFASEEDRLNADYLVHRRAYYARVRRWAGETFWRRRAGEDATGRH